MAGGLQTSFSLSERRLCAGTSNAPERRTAVKAGRQADDLLAEAVAHEEHRVFCDVGHQRRRGALVEATQAHLFVGGHDAVDEASVHRGEGLHLDFGRVQGLPAEDARSATFRNKSMGEEMLMFHHLRP